MAHHTRLVFDVFVSLAALLVFGAVPSVAGTEGGEVSAAADASRPFIVKIHADWCGTCTRLNPTFEALHRRLGSSVRLVVLDVTDREALGRSRDEAERLGIREFFESHKSRTGTVGVLHGATREPVSVLKGETDVAAYEAAVARAVSGGSS